MSRSVTITISEVSDHTLAAVLAVLVGGPVPWPAPDPAPASPPVVPVTSARDIAVGDFAALAAYTTAMDPEDIETWPNYSADQQPERWRQLVHKQLLRAGRSHEALAWWE